ncbi:MAG: putative LPS assembly protein LptD [Chitinophagaceae bacterium]
MKQLYKFRPKIFLNWILTATLLFTLTWKTAAIDIGPSIFYSPLTAATDTIKPRVNKDSILSPILNQPDTTRLPDRDSIIIKQTIDTFSLKLSKDSMDAPLKYEAEDSVVVLIQSKKILLYGKTKTEFKDITLTAPKVEVDQQTQIVTAVNIKDSTGEVKEIAEFVSGDNNFTSDTIRYNFKTQVGLTQNTYTEQGEFHVFGEVAKKIDANTTFIKRARFSTCNLDHPHFSIVTPKMKVINQKLAVSGPAHMEFEEVPIPIYLPFGFYPLSQGRHSGLLPPQFTTNEQFGLGLEGLGYYKVLSDYWDTKIYGNLYSYGGWSVNVEPTYRKRYRYNGRFNVSMQTTKINFKGDPDFTKSKTFFVTWSHAVDSRARPGTTFTASVNAGSTKYNQFIPNNTQLNFQNQLGSTIAYSKSWVGKPYNLTLSANHNQNNSTRLVNVSLPDAGFSVSTLYPFERKKGVGSAKWFEKLGVGYNGNFRNQVSFYDTTFILKRLLDTLQWGASHNFPISLSLPPILGGAVIVAPSVSYSQVWIAQKFRRNWNPATKKVDTTITKGFFMDHQMAFSLGFNTALYGTYQFKNSRIQAIRHVIRPSLSMNYKPDLSKNHFYTTQLDTTGYVNPYPLSEFEGALYQGFSSGRTGGLGFQLDNNLEMKWRSKKDTGVEAIKKIRLIDGYGFSTGYNFLRDSLKLELFNLYFRTTLFEKINITANSIFDPYQFNENGIDIDKYAWEDGKFKLGRLTSGSVSITTSFQSKPKDPKKDAEQKKLREQQLNDPGLIADQQRLLDYMQQNPAEFVDFNIPWQFSIGYSLYFSNRLRTDLRGFEKDFNSGANFSGSFSLTPKWNFSLNGNFDFETKKLQTFQMSINREMHCWQMSINVTPIGLFRSFNFSISPKSSVLQDLKINRSRYFSSY